MKRTFSREATWWQPPILGLRNCRKGVHAELLINTIRNLESWSNPCCMLIRCPLVITKQAKAQATEQLATDQCKHHPGMYKDMIMVAIAVLVVGLHQYSSQHTCA